MTVGKVRKIQGFIFFRRLRVLRWLLKSYVQLRDERHRRLLRGDEPSSGGLNEAELTEASGSVGY